MRNLLSSSTVGFRSISMDLVNSGLAVYCARLRDVEGKSCIRYCPLERTRDSGYALNLYILT